jgi:uncharacterized repeat protein (TIGR01451 family)
MVVDAANGRLYAINEASSTVSAYSIDASSGALSALPFSPITLGTAGDGIWKTLAVHPAGSPLLVADGDSSPEVSSFSITDTTAVLAEKEGTGLAWPVSSALSASGDYLYTGGFLTNDRVAGLGVTSSTGALTPLAGSPFSTGANYPVAYATDLIGRLFLANRDAGTVRAFTTSAGIPTAVTGNPFASGLSNATDGLLHPSGQFYFVADPTGNQIGSYRILGTGSATTLAPAAGSPFSTGGSGANYACSLAANHAGTYLFVANGLSRRITTFPVNTTTGALSSPVIQPPSAMGAAGRLTGMGYYVPPVADVQVTISDSPDPVVLGDGIAYTVNLTNAGPTSASNVVVEVSLPAGLADVTLLPPVGWVGQHDVGSRLARFTKSPVAPGENAVLVVYVATGAGTASLAVASVTAATSTPDTIPANNSATTTTTVTVAEVAVTKTAAVANVPVTTVTPGRSFDYVLQVRNYGTGAAQGLVLTDTLPAGVLFMGVDAPGWGLTVPAVGTSGTITATRAAALQPAQEAYLVVTGHLDQALPEGTVASNTATVTSANLDPNPANNSSTTAITAAPPQADLQLASSVQREVNTGGALVVQFSPYNGGPSQAVNPQVTLTFSTGLALRSLTAPAGWSCSSTGNAVSCLAPVLRHAPSTAGYAVLDVTASAGTAQTVTGSISSPTLDPVPGNNTVSESVSVVGDGSDTIATATPLGTTPIRVNGRLFPAGDIDYYSFAGRAGDRVYAAVVTAGATSGAFDVLLRLLGPGGTPTIEEDDDNGTYTSTSPSIAGAYLPADGTYLLAVTTSPAVSTQLATGPYDLYVHLRSGTPSAEVEPGGTLPPSRWVSGVILASDIDSFDLAVNAGDTVFASLDLDPANAAGARAGGTRWNGTLSLTPAGGFPILANDTSTQSPNSEALFATLASAGTVTLTVTAATGAGPSASYHLNIAIMPATADAASCRTYSSSEVPKAIGPDPATCCLDSTVFVPDSVRVGRVALELDLTHTRFNDLDVTLIAPGGTEVPVMLDAISSDATAVTVRLAAASAALPVNSPLVSLSSLVLAPSLREMLTWFDGHPAQGTWTLRVRDDAAGNGGTLNGWHLTICPEVAASCPAGTQAKSLLFGDFESDNGAFTHSGTQDEWEWGAPSVAPITTCASGTRCWKTDLDGIYQGSADASLYSPSLVVPATAGSVVVSWHHKHQLEPPQNDNYTVDLVDGAHLPVRPLYYLRDGVGTVSVGVGETVPVAAGWARRQIMLTGLEGQTVGLRYRMTSNASGNLAGVAIDDVGVAACLPSADLSITVSDTPDPVTCGGTVTYALVVSNAGPSAASGVQVTDALPAMTIFVSAAAPPGWTLATPGAGAPVGGTVTAMKASMAVGETATITIVAQVPALAATLSNTATVSATDSTDPYAGNNDATASTIVSGQPTALAPAVTITAPTTAATYTATQAFVTVAGTASDETGIAAVTWASDRGPSGTATGTTAWSAQIPLVAGVNVITVTVTDTDTPSHTTSATLTLTLPELRYYLAEGATGDFFDFDLLIANPNPVEAPVTITFLREDATTVTETRTLLPTSRTTIPVKTLPGLDVGAMSTVVTSTAALPLVVERSMFWQGTRYYAAHGGTAVPGPATRWYFAEGSQGFFDTYVLLANANPVAATATVAFLTEAAGTVTRTIPLPPTSRTNVFTGALPELFNTSFAIVVEADQPIIAERAMYFGTTRFWDGGHESVGVTGAATEWFLAEGATGFFDEYVLVGNANATDATVTLTYLLDTGATVTRVKTMAPGSRLTVPVADEDAALARANVSTRVTSDVPVIVERAMYWPAPFTTWAEAHNSFGVTETALRWGLAEGRVGGPHAFETYVLLANPNATAAEVRLTFLREDGTTVVKDYTVAPTSRFNVPVNAFVPELADEDFAVVIEVRNGVPIAVERALYNNDAAGTWWAAGTNATATRLP